MSHVDPCITRATDASGLVFTPEKFSALAASGRRCYLLSPHPDGPAPVNYLRIGERSGIPQRFLPSHRPVWYLPENRAVADIWVAVFSRETVKFILNRSGTKNLTCFHGLYAKAGHKNLAPLLTLYLNSSWGREAFAQVNRFYGDGLNKLEPKDVEALPCPALPMWRSEQAEDTVKGLAELELLPAAERKARIDQLVATALHVPAHHAPMRSVFPYCVTPHSGKAARSAFANIRSAQSPIARFARNSERASFGTVGLLAGEAPAPPKAKRSSLMPLSAR